MGAWIETKYAPLTSPAGTSHSIWVRGLKRISRGLSKNKVKSHSIWVRGLKQRQSQQKGRQYSVALYMGAWIETESQINELVDKVVALYMGAWIETLIALQTLQRLQVALYMGAWIETVAATETVTTAVRRTLYGCVD